MKGKLGPRAQCLWAGFLTLLIAGPWLLAWLCVRHDWPGPRHFIVPTTSRAVRHSMLLVVVSAVVSAEITTKLVIVVALFARRTWRVSGPCRSAARPRAIAGPYNVVNRCLRTEPLRPAAVIAGYAVLPWIAAGLLDLLGTQLAPALILAAELTALGISDLHLLIGWPLAGCRSCRLRHLSS